MTSVRAQLLVHRRCNKRLPRQFRRHLALHRKPTATGRIRTDLVVPSDHMPVQYLEPLKGAADFFIDAASKTDDNWLPPNFGWIANLIRVHFLTPRLLPGPKLGARYFVPSLLQMNGCGA